MQLKDGRPIDELRRELTELTDYQNASLPMIKVPPGTKTREMGKM